MSSPETTAVTGRLLLPAPTRSPWWELGRRVLMAVAILVFTVLLVYADRRGYGDTSDGKVGMIGGSYLGIAQWKLALLNNPHLKAISPVVLGPGPLLAVMPQQYSP